MNKFGKVMLVAVATVMASSVCMARGHHGGGGHRGGGHRGGGSVVVVNNGHRGGGHHRHHGGSTWGRGGRNFWPGFVGGIIGGALTDAVVGPRTTYVSTPVVTPAPVVVQPAPVVVQQPVVVQPTPVYTTQRVWVEGRYVDQVQANGAVVRVWEPGHYEERQVLVQ